MKSSEFKNKLAAFNEDKNLEITNLMTDMSNKLVSQENFILKLANERKLAGKEHKLQEQSLWDSVKIQRWRNWTLQRFQN